MKKSSVIRSVGGASVVELSASRIEDGDLAGVPGVRPELKVGDKISFTDIAISRSSHTFCILTEDAGDHFVAYVPGNGGRNIKIEKSEVASGDIRIDRLNGVDVK